MSSDLDDNVLETIRLSKIFGAGKGAKVRLEAINMKELNDTGIEMSAGNLILVMLQHFIRTFERCGELSRQEIARSAERLPEDQLD